MINNRNIVLILGLCMVALACSDGSTGPITQDTDRSPNPTAPAPSAETPSVDETGVFAGLPAPYDAADYANGRRQFRLCQSCHKISPDMTALVGPNLYGMFTRGVGEVDGFRYSQALVDADFSWTSEKLDEWLASPRDFLPGNQMSFAGIRKEDARRDLIAYLLIETASD